MTDRIKENFEDFHREHPEVADLFDRFALLSINAGRSHGSAGLIFERIRWEKYVKGLEGIPRLNNNYRALYSRRFEKVNPQYKGFFRKRKRRSNTVDSTKFDEPED